MTRKRQKVEPLKLILVFMTLSIIMSACPKLVDANETMPMVDDIDEIDTLEYFVEFDPQYDNLLTTNYTYEFTQVGNDLIVISTDFDDKDLTAEQEDFEFNVSLDVSSGKWIVDNVSNVNYHSLMAGDYSELICNMSSPIRTAQSFRIDEFMLFESYLETDGYSYTQTQSNPRVFTYDGTETYSRNLIGEVDALHYSVEWSFFHGCG